MQIFLPIIQQCTDMEQKDIFSFSRQNHTLGTSAQNFERVNRMPIREADEGLGILFTGSKLCGSGTQCTKTSIKKAMHSMQVVSYHLFI